jgi:hypothetical protein
MEESRGKSYPTPGKSECVVVSLLALREMLPGSFVERKRACGRISRSFV